MPNGRLLIGTGIGEASVQNSQPAVQAFVNVLAQNKAKRDAEKQALINQAGALKTNGLRDADRNDYYNAYNDWKNTAIQANNAASNSREKLDLQGEALQKYNQLNDFVNRSKLAGTDYHQKANMFLQDNFRHQFKDDAVNNFLGVKDLPMGDPRFQQYSDVNNLERQVDANKVDAAIEKARTQAINGSQWNNGTIVPGDVNIAGKKGQMSYQQRGIPFEGENGVLHRLLNATDASSDFLKSLDDRYGDIQGATPKETTAARIKQYAIDKGYDQGWIEKSKPKFTAYDDSFAKHVRNRMFDISHPIRGEKAEVIPATPQDINIPYNSGNPGKEGTVQAKGYVPLSIPNKNFAGTPAYSLTNGKAVPALESSGSYGVVGVGNFPIISGTGGKLDGTIAQPNFMQSNPNKVQLQPMVHVQKKAESQYDTPEDFVIPYNKLPANIKNSKPVKEALAGFTPATQGTQPAQTAPTVKSTPKAEPVSNSGYKSVTTAKNAKGEVVQIGVKNGKWYYVKTNKEVDEPL